MTLRVRRGMKVHVFQGATGFWYWHLKAENGETSPTQPRATAHKGDAITMAEKLNPGAELVVDDKLEG
jgi:hypothetical protein